MLNSDLKQRVPIAILYVLAIAVSFLYTNWSAETLLCILYFMSLLEFINIQFNHSRDRILWICFNLIIVGPVFIFNYISLFFVSLAILMSGIFIFNGALLFTKKISFLNIIPKLIRPVIFLSLPTMLGIYGIENYFNFRYVILGSFIIIWLNDAGAYFVGKAWGKRKILSAVSPGKSWEGWIGGLVIGSISAIIIAQFYRVMDIEYWLLLSIILPFSGLIGDLTESTWKRLHSIKDSGTILKGHGGFLDRLDSFFYSIPFIVLLFELQN